MRVLCLSADPGVPVLGGKGASVHVRAMAAALRDLGARVVVASPRAAAGGERIADSIELVTFEAVLPKDHAAAASLRGAVERQAEQIRAIARICSAWLSTAPRSDAADACSFARTASNVTSSIASSRRSSPAAARGEATTTCAPSSRSATAIART